MGSRLAYLDLTLAHSKGQGQCQAHFDCERMRNGDRSIGQTLLLPSNMKSNMHMGFRLQYLYFTLLSAL